MLRKWFSRYMGPGQPIWGHIQRHFDLSCVYRIYFLRNSTEFRDMQAEFKRIKTSRPFLTVIHISHKLPAISWSLAPQSFPNRSPVCWSCAVKLLPCFRGWKIEPFFKDSLSWSWSIFSEWTWSLNINQDELVYPTHQTFCLLWGVQRNLLVHIPSHKDKTFHTITFIWV